MKEAIIEAPKCGMCGVPMTELSERTSNFDLIVWVCNNKKNGKRLPCDGRPPALYKY